MNTPIIPYLTTASGKKYDLYAPVALTQERSPVDINDIAHHLAHITRYTGAASRIYTVAEHSLLCARIARDQGLSPAWQLAALMHDAHEAYTNDMATPTKQALRLYNATTFSAAQGKETVWDLFEEEHQDHVLKQLGLTSIFCSPAGLQVAIIDEIALVHEWHMLMPATECLADQRSIKLYSDWLRAVDQYEHLSPQSIAEIFLQNYENLKLEIKTLQTATETIAP